MKGSIIKYFGGKGTMYNKIIEHFPEQGSYNTYIEPFAGSFSIGLKKPDCPIEIYNDKEQNVYSLYKVLSDKNLFEEFKFLADLHPYSEDFRKEFKEKLKGELTLVERAFYFFYTNRSSHNGVGGFSLNSTIRRKMSKSVSDYLSVVDRLEDIHQRLSKVTVLNRDGIELIEKYNNENCLIYCDPPYHHDTRTSARYKEDMDNETQIKFLESVNNSNSKILISGYKNDVYNSYLKNWEEINFEVKTMSGTFEKKIKIENLWKNY
jgi:DNA adenine methylase